jgi:hypothetical protein
MLNLRKHTYSHVSITEFNDIAFNGADNTKYKKYLLTDLFKCDSETNLVKYDTLYDIFYEMHLGKNTSVSSIKVNEGFGWKPLTREEVSKRLKLTLRKDKINKIREKI